MEGKINEEPRKKKFPLVRLNYDEMMAEFNSCAVRPKTIAAPERKEKLKLQRIVFNPSDFEDSPPKRSKLKQPKPNKVRSSGAINSKRTTNIKPNWNLDKEKPKLVTEELNQAKIRKKSFNPAKAKIVKHNVVKVVKNQENKGSLTKHSTLKEKLKLWSHLPMESKKLDFSTNTPDWKVAEVHPNKKVALSPGSELSPTECEFLEIEKSLKMKDAATLSTDVANWEAEIQKILEQDKNEIFKFQSKVDKLVDEFITAQDRRNQQIMKVLKTAKSNTIPNVNTPPLRDITSKANRRSPSLLHSDGKVLWKSKKLPEDKVMDKAITLYNSMRNISKSILATPKLNRSSLQTPESIKKSAGVSISKIIQKQCLMLHETPYKN